MARKKHNIHYIYKTTCNVTGRWYIGMHSTSNLDDGYMGSGLRLRRSIRKYGVDNHTKEILEFFETRELLIEAEKKAITPDMLTDENCMNLKKGGSGGFSSEEAKKGRVKTNQILSEKYGLNFNSVLRKIFHKNMSDDEKIVHIAKIKKGQKESGYDFGTFRGKSHSEDSKQKISESRKGIGSGSTNSQYGTCWITKDGLNKKIKKEDLDSFLLDGWIQGRKQNK